MNKYSDIEIQTAKNLLKKGYKWIARNKYGRLYAHAAKPSKVGTYWWSVGNIDHTCDYVPIFQSVRFDDKEPTSLASVAYPPVLDDVEKKNLWGVIAPFGKNARYVMKHSEHLKGIEEILVGYHSELSDEDLYFDLPPFKAGTMYTGIEPDRKYSLEELGL